MGLFWSSSPAPSLESYSKPKSTTVSSSPAACPVSKTTAQSGATCPVTKSTAANSGATCPVVGQNNDDNDINPLTNMPYNLPYTKAPNQTIDLPTERTLSTIPRGEEADQGVWEYPSPQQMFNAMLRKGKGDIPEDAVESMVNIHNFLNEGAWEEIIEWEKPYTNQSKIEPRLLKFTGRPDQLSPRAQWYIWMSKLFPDSYGSEPPFDRHDWTVLRSDGHGEWKQIRYVIDYYSGGEDQFGLPVFSLDVRPALDNFENGLQRFNHWTDELKPTWDKAMGKEQNSK